MKIEEILETFEHFTGRLPESSIIEARKKKKTITPKLLEMLQYTEDHIDEITKNDNTFFGYIFAIFLLAEWREKKAFPYLIKFLDTDDDTASFIFGDDYPDYVPRLLASTYNGDDEALFSLIEKRELDEFIRSSILSTFVILYLEGIKDRSFLVDYLTTLIKQRDDSYLNFEIVDIVGKLKLTELDGTIDELFDIVDKELVEELKNIFADKNYEINRFIYPFVDQCDYIDDTIEIMEKWQCFNYDEDEEYEYSDYNRMCKDIINRRNNRFQRKIVGRNDACTCGSGKKYKKCCMNKTPNNKNLDTIDRSVSKAEWLMFKGKEEKARNLFRLAWFDVQDLCSKNNITSIKEYDTEFKGFDFLQNWIQDYLFSLEKSNKIKDAYERLNLCDTFEKTFDLKDEKELYWKETFLRSRANAEFAIGHTDQATKIIEDYLKGKPAWVWGYVEMADWYLAPKTSKYYDLEKSKEILKRAESIENLEDIDVIYERLIDIFKAQENTELEKNYEDKLESLFNNFE